MVKKFLLTQIVNKSVNEKQNVIKHISQKLYLNTKAS